MRIVEFIFIIRRGRGRGRGIVKLIRVHGVVVVAVVVELLLLAKKWVQEECGGVQYYVCSSVLYNF